ncbi:MAG: type II secretion system F family protein [Pseudomonadota bacterium]|jgi:general secretion pathway protein F
MDCVWRYQATDADQRVVRGAVIAPSRDLAWARLAASGLRPGQVGLDLARTCAHALVPRHDPRDLERLYRSLGQRLAHGTPMPRALAGCEALLRDPLLREAVRLMRLQALGGSPLHASMAAVGLPAREAVLVRAAEAAGDLPAVLLQLAEAARSRRQLDAALARVLWIPLATAGFLYVFVFVTLMYAAPRTLAFFERAGARLPPYAADYFAFAREVGESPVLAWGVFLALPAALLAVVRTRFGVGLIDRLPVWRELSTRADLSAQWAGFARLLRARVPPAEAASMVRDAGRRADCRAWFAGLVPLLQAGVFLAEAASRAGFPAHVCADVAAAEASGRLPDSLERMARELDEDVTGLAARLADVMQLASMLLLGAGVVAVFFLSYGPIMAVGLRNA